MRTDGLPLHTERLIVRRFEDRDIPDVVDYSQHDENDRFRERNVGWELTEEGVRSYWTPMAAMSVVDATSWLALVIEVKALGRVVGNTGFNTKKIGEHAQAMIGCILGQAFEGNGYATEAVTALLDYLFFAEKLHRVFASTSPENAKSWRLMERLGMRREAHFRRNCFVDDTWGDEYIYAVLEEEWRTRRR